MFPDALLDVAPCGYVAFADDGRVTLVNATLLDRLGYRRDELTGKHVDTIFTVATKLFFQTHVYPLVKMHGRADEVFLLVRTKVGEELGVLCNAVRRASDGGAGTTHCILLEVNQRRKYEDALLEARRAAERATQQVEQQAAELEVQTQQLQDQATELEVQSEALQSMNDELTVRGIE